jgi:uncharacterized membrane protein
MLSNHYPLAFATEYNLIIASLVFLMGVTIRHYFNTLHARKGNQNWTWLATAVIFILIMWLSTAPGSQREELATLTPMQQRFAEAGDFTAVADTVRGRCSMCHATESVWPGVPRAPKGVILETDAEIAAHAREIYLQAGRSHAMPPGNVTEMEPGERRLIVDWYRSATSG